MSKIITVFGATGNQGGSVIRYILADPVLSKEFKIRGITRDTSKPSAKALAEKGVEVVTADMNSTASIAAALKDAHTVFLVTNFWEVFSKDIEYNQGKNVADAAKAAGVSHIIFSSLINVTEASGGRLSHVAHFDGKAEIAKYIEQIGLSATFVLPGYFMSNFEQALKKEEDGSYGLYIPLGEKAQFPLFDVADTGKFVTAAIKNYPTTIGKNLYAAADYYTPNRIVSEFTEVTGIPAKVVRIDEATYKSFLPAPVAQELYENHLLLEEPGYYAGASLGESIGLLEQKPTSWKEFLGKSAVFKK
ncbi:hypothetical protein FQN55_003463 [Onygenales sp. PD_40]|nr:hypothetical protein FQN55_003463 [Onygenales sp. PD_40]KAK2783204.1 hypothetical protein FQN52_000418 [Onygenales sp. PD_12]KAK2802871.1 hypothetical protein FQN51_004133 [Onygenales sp. PD_10]